VRCRRLRLDSTGIKCSASSPLQPQINYLCPWADLIVPSMKATNRPEVVEAQYYDDERSELNTATLLRASGSFLK
jgi:hypothetical protein